MEISTNILNKMADINRKYWLSMLSKMQTKEISHLKLCICRLQKQQSVVNDGPLKFQNCLP